MKNHAMLLCAALTAILVLGFQWADPPNVSHSAHADESGPSEYETLTYEYMTHVNDVAGKISEIEMTGRTTVPLDAETTITLVLTEYDVFVPGERRVTELDGDGNVIRDDPYSGHQYRGGVEGRQGQWAYFSADPTYGLYGVVYTNGHEYSMQPLEWLAGGIIRQEVSWTDATIPPPPSGEPDTITQEYWIKPWAEQSYVNYVSDWASRMVNAYGYAAAMWENEVKTKVRIYSPTNSAQNFASENTCQQKSNSGLQKFRTDWVRTHMNNFRNAYGLFHAYDGQNSIMGCAYSDALQFYSTTPDLYNEWASHAVQGKDWSWTDTYDPKKTAHLAKAVHHEITHNAGEEAHPGHWNSPCDINLMANWGAVDCKQFWRIADSQTKVRDYGWPRFKDV